MAEIDLKRVVLEYLSRNKLMSLATSSQDQPWASTLFFSFDDQFNLLFMSKEDTLHATNIKRNPKVAVTINQEWGKPGLVKGVQYLGRARVIPQEEFGTYYQKFISRYTWAEKFKQDHSLFEIKPVEVWYLDHELLGHFHRVRVI